MPSSELIKDFTAFGENPYPGMIVPESLNDLADDGSGYPGMQRAIFNRMRWYLHSGNMESGIHMANEDVTGVNLLYLKDTSGNIASLTGSQIDCTVGLTGVRGNFTNSITGVRANFTTDITGTKGLITTADGLKIGSNTPSSAQWGYLSAMNQGVATSSSVAFAAATINGTLAMGGNAITTSSTVDGVDVSTLNTNYTNHAANENNPHVVILQDLTPGTVDGNIAMGTYTLTNIGSGNANGEPIRFQEFKAHEDNTSNPHAVVLADLTPGTADGDINMNGSTLTSLESGNANGEPVRYDEYIAHQNNNGSHHSYINQGVTTTSNVTFSQITGSTIKASSATIGTVNAVTVQQSSVTVKSTVGTLLLQSAGETKFKPTEAQQLYFHMYN